MEHFPWIGALVLLGWLILTILKVRRRHMVAPDEATVTFCPIPSYQITLRDGLPTITCLRCHMTSWHPQDVQHLYCGNCHEYHIEKIESPTRVPNP